MIRLSKYYLVIGIPWIIISIIGVTWMYRIVALDDLKRLTEKNTVMLTHALANVIWPQINGLVDSTVNHPPDNHDHDEHIMQSLQIIRTVLDEPIFDLLKGTSVLKVKIFNINGLTVYSTDRSQLGEKMPEGYMGAKAIETNQVISHARFKDSIKSFKGMQLEDRFVVSSYLPIHYFNENVTEGVFEIYNDATDIYYQINESQVKFASALSVMITFVYILVFFFVRRADKAVKTNIDLAIARDSAKKANHAKSMFLANMSHELRTPLNAIIGYSEIIQENAHANNDKESIEDSNRIQSAARHLLHLINEVLDISKIEAGQENIYLEYVKINVLIEEITKLVKPMLVRNNNTLKLQCDNQLDCIKTDVVKFKQILFNLLSNATKFTQNGEINLFVRKDRDWLDIVISDTGVGIESDKIPDLFKPFSQADSSTTRKYGGTGLGLAITKHYCEMLGGDISVSSQYKLGTTFTIKLPILSAERDNNDDLQQEVA